MKRNVLFGALLVVLAGGAVVALLGGPTALFGPSQAPGEGGPGEGAPEAAGGAPAAGAPAGAEAGREGVLAGRRRPERRGTGTLTARVVRVGTEKPVVGAALSVKGSGYGGEAVDVRGTTDAQGLVKLAAVAAGEAYVARVEAEGEAAVVIPDVEVRAGRTKDLGTVVVGARAPLAGRVVDEAGAPVVGADVRAFTGYESLLDVLGNMMELFSSLGREPTALARTTSDAEGRFRLADLPPGPLVVRATAPGRQQAVATVRMTPSGPAAGAPTLVLEPGAVVAGLVVDSNGAGVPSASLAILNTAGDRDPMDFLARRVFATTDAKGAFQAVVGEGAKKMRAIVEAEGYPSTMSPEFDAGDSALRILLSRGAEIEIHLHEAGSDAPIAGGQVLMAVTSKEGMNEPEASGGILYGVTDAEGTVVLASPPGGIDMLMVSHPLYGQAMASPNRGMGDMGRGGLQGDVPRAVKAGVRTRMSLKLQRGVAVTGRVLGPGSAPIVGAEVRTFAFGFGAGGGSVRSGADGAYRLEGVSSNGGQGAMVMVRASGFVGTGAQLAIDAAAQQAGEVHQDFTLSPAALVRGRVLDEAGQGVAGAQVVVAGGDMGFDQFFGDAAVTTAADGTFALRDVDPSGRGPFNSIVRVGRPEDPPSAPKKLRVRASAEGYVSGTSEGFVVPVGGDVEAPPIRLSRGATLRGVVREPAGRPAAGAQVEMSFTPEGDGPNVYMFVGRPEYHRTLRADREGRFEASAVPKGTATVTARASGFAASRRTVKVTDEAAAPLEVSLRTALDLSGHVLGGDGRPLAGAAVSTDGSIEGLEGDDAYAEPASATTGPEGQFVLKGLPPGTESVTVAADGHRTAHATAAPGGAALEVRLEARSGADPKRLAEVRQELNDVIAKYRDAKDDAERQALQNKLMELSKELDALQKQSQDAGESPPVKDAPGGR